MPHITVRVAEEDRARYVLAAQIAKRDLSSYLRECLERFADAVESGLPEGINLAMLTNMSETVDKALDAQWENADKE